MKLSEIKQDMCEVMPILEGIWTHIIRNPESILWTNIFCPKSGTSSRMNTRTDTLPLEWILLTASTSLWVHEVFLSPLHGVEAAAMRVSPQSTWASAWLVNSWRVESSFRFILFPLPFPVHPSLRSLCLNLGRVGAGGRQSAVQAFASHWKGSCPLSSHSNLSRCVT